MSGYSFGKKTDEQWVIEKHQRKETRSFLESRIHKRKNMIAVILYILQRTRY